MIKKYSYDELLQVNGIKLTKKYIQSLTKEERLELIDPIFNILRFNGFPLPDNNSGLQKSYDKLVNYKVDTSVMEMYNNSSLATNICKFYCAKPFYSSTEEGKKNMFEIFEDDETLRKVIKNRLGLIWNDGSLESFNLSPKMLIQQAFRSMRLVNNTTFFKPEIAKVLYCKYSNEGDTVFDYSCGWGARALGAASCNRNYIGVDPLTTPYVQIMVNDLNLKNIKLINDGSENIKLEENSIDFSFSSPPYMEGGKRVQEYYSKDESQAYSKGIDYFYNIYWRNTLKNIKHMLKPNKFFGLNIFDKDPKMINITKEYFGNHVEVFKLKTVKSHLSHKSKEAGNSIKFENIFIYNNIK